MKILDCESVDSTYSSLESIINVNTDKIRESLSTFDADLYYENHRNYYGSGDELLFKVFRREYRITSKFDGTCWFHLTRTFRGNTFKEGLLPLNACINLIWDYLFSLLNDDFTLEEWHSFKECLETDLSLHHAKLYRLKFSNSIHWGPYAMLVRDAAFNAESMGNHDYLGGSEIVEDICFCFDKLYNYDLLERYVESTVPCIVKFKTNKTRSYYIGIALLYLYNMSHGKHLSLISNTCFNANNTAISPKSILKIEYLESL